MSEELLSELTADLRKPQTSSLFVLFPAEAQAEEPAAETDHGPTAKPHLGDQLHVGHQELRHHRQRKVRRTGEGVTVNRSPQTS